MDWMFWKKKTDAGSDAEAVHEEADDTDTSDVPLDDEVPDEEVADPDQESMDSPQPDSAGLPARIKMQFAALVQRLRKTPEPVTEEEEDEERPPERGRRRTAEAGLDDVPEEADEAPPRPARNYLLISGVIVLLSMVLTGFGFVIWKVFMTHPVQHTVTPGIVEPPRAIQPQVSHNEAQQAEVEALRKRNEELQTQLDALKRGQPQAQQPAYQASGGASGGVPPNVAGGLAISTKDPKASAQGLKEAIDAMNAANGDNAAGKPRK